MAQATFSIRMDESLKNQFDNLCKEFGMNASTALIFLRVRLSENVKSHLKSRHSQAFV